MTTSSSPTVKNSAGADLMDTDAAEPEPSRRRWLIASILFLAVLSAFFDRISVAVLFTNVDFQNALGTGFNPTRMGLLMSSFVFAYGCSGILLSFMGDVYGMRRTLAIGTACWGILIAMMGASGSFTAMLTLRILLGVAEGPQFSITNSLVKRWFPKKEHARANSVWMIGSPLGSAIGFPLMIYLESTFGWRIAFMFLAALNLLVILPLVLLVIRDYQPNSVNPEQRVTVKPKFSYLSQVGLYFRDWRFWMLVIFNSAAMIYLWGLNSWLPSYLVKMRGFDLKQTSLYAFLPFFMMFIGEIFSAFFSDRIGRRAVFSFTGLILAGASMYIVTIVANSHTAAIMIAISAFFWGAALPPLFALATQILPSRAMASGVGMFNGLGNIIGAFSPLIIGWLIVRTGTFNAGLIFLVGATIIGSFAMLPLIKRY